MLIYRQNQNEDPDDDGREKSNHLPKGKEKRGLKDSSRKRELWSTNSDSLSSFVLRIKENSCICRISILEEEHAAVSWCHSLTSAGRGVRLIIVISILGKRVSNASEEKDRVWMLLTSLTVGDEEVADTWRFEAFLRSSWWLPPVRKVPSNLH